MIKLRLVQSLLPSRVVYLFDWRNHKRPDHKYFFKLRRLPFLRPSIRINIEKTNQVASKETKIVAADKIVADKKVALIWSWVYFYFLHYLQMHLMWNNHQGLISQFSYGWSKFRTEIFGPVYGSNLRSGYWLRLIQSTICWIF